MNLFCGGNFLKGSLGKDPWKLIFSFSDSEKLLYVLKLPAGLLSRKNYDFLIFWTCPESKSMHFLKFGHFLKNGSPGQTTMLTRRAAKFWVEPRSPFSYISHHDPKTLGKRLIIVSWPECRPEFPRDDDGGGGGGGGFPRTLPIWSCPGSITRRDQISRAGNPSLRWERFRQRTRQSFARLSEPL